MNGKVRKKVFVMPWILCLMLILMPTAALPWDAATHAYIEEHLYKMQGQTDQGVLNNRIYGATALDIFNNNFTSPYIEFAAYLHGSNPDNFLKPWEIAASMEEKAFAYGFVGHNNAWGMDSTAHVSGITYGRGEGYVIAKARELAVMLRPALPSPLNTLPDDVLVNLCHYLVESGVDFLVRDLDPSIGYKLMNSAGNRSGNVPTLLVNAYAADFSSLAGISMENAKQIIRTAESNFQATMISYGWALTQDKALDLVTSGLAQIGASYLSALGIPPIPEATLKAIAVEGINSAESLCAPDFERELKATTGWVNGRLSSKGIVWR